MKRPLSTRPLASLCVVLLLSPTSAFAVDFFWTNPGTGNWFEPTNWNTGTVPSGDGGNFAFINNGGTATIDADLIDQVQDPIIGSGAGNSGTINQTAGTHTITNGWTFVGRDGGTGTYRMSGSARHNTEELRIGTGAGATGTMTLTDSAAVTTTSNLHVGRNANANGTLSLSGNAVVNSGRTFIGVEGATGTYTVEGAASVNSERIYVGGTRDVDGGGTGTMTIATTGTVTATGDLAVGTRGGTGLLTVNAGTVNANSWMIVGESHNGTGGSNGTVVQNGGALTVAATDANGRLWIGSQEGSASPASNGTYTLNDGTLTTPEAQIGRHYTGTFNQTGGTFSITDPLRESGLGEFAGSVGTYNMAGGVLNSATNFQIGRSGTGNFLQTGGIVNASNFPSIGRFGGSTGTLSVSGGAFNQVGAGGRLIVGEDGVGTLNLSATGVLNSEGGISLGHNAVGNGTFNLDGGMVTTPFIENGNAGIAKFNFNGGVLRASQTEGDFFRSLNFAASEIEVKSGGAKFDSNGFDVTINQGLAGAGGLAKQGAGALILVGANTFAGDTVVEGGTLRLGSAASLASPQIIVKAGAGFDVTLVTGFTLASGQTLGGGGSVFGDVALALGAELAPGDGGGSLSFTNGLDIDTAIAGTGTGALEFELGLLGASDLVFLGSGVLSIGSGLLEFDDFDFAALAGFGGGTYTLFDTSSALDGTLGTNLTGTIGGLDATLTTADGGRDLVVNVVPEPASVAMLLGGLVLLARRRRR
jgi:autotransporter-associated beta strand protein/T5SS/PEP-CTERM-associated repeat protein